MELDEIQRRSKTGPFLMLARRAFAVIIGLLTAAIIPHFLGPPAYGLAAMATLVFALGEIFKDFGLGSALLRKGSISQEEVTFLFWFNIATTILISATIACASPLAAMFFHQPVLTSIILVSLVGFALSGAAMQHRALLNRDLRFADVAMIDSASLLLQFALTLLLAVLRYGVWAIVFGNVAYSVINAVLCVVRSKWHPGKPQIIEEFKAIAHFGANTSIYSLAIFFSTNITPILIGNTQSVANLGQYNMANNILSLPLKNLVDPLAQATLPILARLRLFPELYRDAYLNFLQKLNLIVLPASAFLLFGSKPVIIAVLGPAWREAGDLLSILAPVVGVLGFGYAVSDLFITQDRSAELRTLGIAETFIRVGAVFVGIKFGLYFATGAYAFASVLAVALRIAVAGSKGPVNVLDHANTILPALPIVLAMAVGTFAAVKISDTGFLKPLPAAALVMGTAVLSGAIGAASVKSSRDAVYGLLRTIRPRPFVK